MKLNRYKIWMFAAAFCLLFTTSFECFAKESGNVFFEKVLKQARKLKKHSKTGKIVVAVPPGAYFLNEPIQITNKDSGTKEQPIVFKVTDPAHTIFSSLKQLPRLHKSRKGYWSCTVPDEFVMKQLYVNGQPRPNIRLPRTGVFEIQKTTEVGEMPKRKKGRKNYSLKNATETVYLKEEDAKTLAKYDFSDARLTVLHQWDCTIRNNVSFDPKTLTLITHGHGMKSWNRWKKGSRLYLENVGNCPLQPGEWRIKGKTFSYAPKRGEVLGRTKLYAPQLEKLFSIEGKKDTPVEYINFVGFRFLHSALILPKGMRPNQGGVAAPNAIVLNSAENIRFLHCEFSKLGGYALWISKRCSDILVSTCLFEQLGAGGIRIGSNSRSANQRTERVIVENCIIRHGGQKVPAAVGIWIIHSPNNKIIHNEINDFNYTGISLAGPGSYIESSCTNNKVLFNHIHHLGNNMMSDMGGVYTLGISPGTDISHNRIHDIWSHHTKGHGLYTDQASSYITMKYNLVYNTRSTAFHQHFGRENNIINNIFVNAEAVQISANDVEEHLSFTCSHNIVVFEKGAIYKRMIKGKSNVDYNIFWNTGSEKIDAKDSKLFDKTSLEKWRASGRDQHSIIGNPKFRNPQKHDYVPQNKALLQKIGFKLFDPMKAGVYKTDPTWFKKAQE